MYSTGLVAPRDSYTWIVKQCSINDDGKRKNEQREGKRVARKTVSKTPVRRFGLTTPGMH